MTHKHKRYAYKVSLLTLITFTTVCFANICLAVDGYKKLKFGSSVKQILKNKPCSLSKLKMGDKLVTAYTCQDFIFGGKNVEAIAYFINGKFLRFGILVDTESTPALVQGLTEKYGVPSSSSGTQSFQVVDQRPNTEAFVAYDADTIYLKIMTDANMNQSVLLLYTSPKFDQIRQLKEKKSLQSDL